MGVADCDSGIAAALADILAALRRGDEVEAKWRTAFAVAEIFHAARESGVEVDLPPAFADEPLKGWAAYGIDVARRGVNRAAGWSPRPGTTHAARAIGRGD
ncbi:hypothetical protein [Magnetospirillum fulvum]|uniref:Uncharacterized protein n=1 Tax=Magnetospirillum fulvum MGU-K5 TaxID=1316936 RepID=S9TQU6_MAGFU|nr:hypothetical protein [Magnetospirillum fulvum]EPY00930.1 hypothetical protein K678_13628 [Magnetospirillum fulvum MGU-K5]